MQMTIKSEIPLYDQKFGPAFEAFFAGVQRISEEYHTKNFPTVPRDPWRVDWLLKRVRIVHGSSSYCFVDYASGNVLKCDGWKRPAKHARGNIFDEHNGLKFIGPYGPAYLR